MKIKFKTVFFITIIVFIIAISRFTDVADIIKEQVTLFLNPAIEQPVTGFTPYIRKELEIRNELKRLVNLANVNAAGLLLFHDEDKNLTVIGNYYFTILYEEVADGLINTTGIFIDLPITSMKGFNIRNLSECSGWEMGTDITHPLFKNLPPRPAIACSIIHQNEIVGVIYVVDSYEKKSLKDLTRLIPLLQKTVQNINKLTN